MASDRKSKKRRSPTNSISEEEEGRSKKHRSSSSSSKRNKKDKVKTKHKHSKHSEKGKKSEEKNDRKRHKRHSGPVEELSRDDYFSKNKEFATWLKEERGLYFSDLSSEAARELFLSFIKDWNNQKLESRYYEGIATAPRTAHNWKITHVKLCACQFPTSSLYHVCYLMMASQQLEKITVCQHLDSMEELKETLLETEILIHGFKRACMEWRCREQNLFRSRSQA